MEQEQIIQFLTQYAQSKGINPNELLSEFSNASPEQQQEFLASIQRRRQQHQMEDGSVMEGAEQKQYMQYGGIPVSMDGLYEFPNQKVIVPNGNITMEGISYPVEAYDADTGEFLQTMQPNQNYQFDVDNVLEIPKGKFGISKMQSGGSKGVGYFSNNFNNDEVRDIMLERRLEREQIAKGEKQALEELKKLKKSKNTKGKIEKNFGKNETKAFFDELEDFTEEQIDDVIKKGDSSKHSGKFKKILRGKGNILLNLFETSPWMQAFIQESSTSPTQVKPNEKQIDSKTAFNLRKQGYNIPDSMIEGNKNTLITPTKSNTQNTPITNYFQPNTQLLPNNFNSNLTDSTSQYSGNTPVEAIGNSNLRVGNRVDTVGGTPVRDFRITNKSPKVREYDFVTGLKPITDRKTMLPVYKDSWLEEWSAIDPNFKKKSFAEQQAFAKNWVKKNAKEYYDGLSNSFPKYNIDKMTSDKKFGSITNQLRPSLIKTNSANREEAIPIFEDVPNGNGNNRATKYTGTVDSIPVSLPQEEKFSFEDAINPADAIVGTFDNRDMSGRYLSSMKIRNNEILPSYFQRADFKMEQPYQIDELPFINDLFTNYNAALQGVDMNSNVGQAKQFQLRAMLNKEINGVNKDVYEKNMQSAIGTLNRNNETYNKQELTDNQFRKQFSEDTALVRTNKQNVDNQIDALAYEHKMNQIKNKNNMLLSTLLHPDFYTTDEGNGQMQLKRKFNKAPTTKVAKYGLKKKAMC